MITALSFHEMRRGIRLFCTRDYNDSAEFWMSLLAFLSYTRSPLDLFMSGHQSCAGNPPFDCQFFSCVILFFWHGFRSIIRPQKNTRGVPDHSAHDATDGVVPPPANSCHRRHRCKYHSMSKSSRLDCYHYRDLVLQSVVTAEAVWAKRSRQRRKADGRRKGEVGGVVRLLHVLLHVSFVGHIPDAPA